MRCAPTTSVCGGDVPRSEARRSSPAPGAESLHGARRPQHGRLIPRLPDHLRREWKPVAGQTGRDDDGGPAERVEWDHVACVATWLAERRRAVGQGRRREQVEALPENVEAGAERRTHLLRL